MRRLMDWRLAAGAVAALAAVGVLALVGVFDGGDGENGRAGQPALPVAGAQDGQAGERINEIYTQYSPGVVFIQAEVVRAQQSPFGLEEPPRGVSTGTGFLIDGQGRIVTNAHVVENARNVAIRAGENQLVPAEVVGADISTDLAVLRIEPDALEAEPLPLGDVGGVEVGDPVLAIGNPFGLEDTITSGIVSAKQRRIEAPDGITISDIIQTDAAVNPGNSGGPLLDMDGRVIGVNSQIATGGGRAFAGIAFAVPVSTVKEIIPDLLDDGEVSRPYLGVSAVTVTPQLAQRLGLQVEQGALVASVAEGSPADQIGLEAAGQEIPGALLGGGDVIVEVGDTAIRSAGDLAGAIGALDPGEAVELTVVRDGERRTERVRVETPPGG